MRVPAETKVAVRDRGQSILRRNISEFARSPLALVGLAVSVIVLLLAVFAPFVTLQNPYDLAQLDILDGMLPPGTENGMGTFRYWLGTDEQGRDIYSGIIYGLRTSLAVGLVATAAAFIIGASVGVIAAYVGGWVDTLVMRIVDLQLSFPSILAAIVMLAVFGRGIDKVIIALILVQWAYYARTVRASALVEGRREYIEAARCLALPARRIVFRHLLPNCLPPLIVIATVQIAHAIALEATLSFLGIGVPVTEPSLGMLISSGYSYLLSGHYWVSTFPGIALLIIIIAINLVGDQLRDVLNPRLAR